MNAVHAPTGKKLTKYQQFRAIAGKRKFGSQLSESEISLIWKKFRDIERWEWMMSGHALDRIKEKGLNATKGDIISMIDFSDIVEYKVSKKCKNMKFDERVVLSSKAVVNGEYNLKVTYSLTDKVIVSAWMNHVDDTHSTLDWSLYDESMKIPV